MLERLVLSATPFRPNRTFNHRRQGYRLERASVGVMTHPTESVKT
ncbi:hypothetical protein [Salinicoccus sp. HZC-1]